MQWFISTRKIEEILKAKECGQKLNVQIKKIKKNSADG